MTADEAIKWVGKEIIVSYDDDTGERCTAAGKVDKLFNIDWPDSNGLVTYFSFDDGTGIRIDAHNLTVQEALQ